MQYIQIKGARLNNLKHINVNLPKNKITAITGVSGCGKSSLIINILHKEAQKKYLQALSLNQRLFRGGDLSSNVDDLKNLSPSIALDQNYPSINKNSNLALLSGIDYDLKVLFSHIHEVYCPVCHDPINSYPIDKIQSLIYDKFYLQKIYIYAQINSNWKGNLKKYLNNVRKKGYSKVKINKKTFYLDQPYPAEIDYVKSIRLLIDVIRINNTKKSQLYESIVLADHEGNGQIVIENDNVERFYSKDLYCPKCDISLKKPRIETFSPNVGINHCPQCSGRGMVNLISCKRCQGTGLDDQSLSFYIENKNFADILNMDLKKLFDFFNNIHLKIVDPVRKEILDIYLPKIINKLKIFITLHMGYISLNRRIRTLSGGEVQRARIVSHMRLGLSNIIYILDEPSIGMHGCEQRSLIKVLKELRNSNNTVLLIEHESQLIKASDYIIELGPLAGSKGGEVIYQGWINKIKENDSTITLDFLQGKVKSKLISNRGPLSNYFIKLHNLSMHNIRSLNLKVLKEAINVVTGVSGAGKSSLIIDLFYPIIKAELIKKRSANYQSSVKGIKDIQQILLVPQKPSKIKSQSTIVSFLKIMVHFRRLFAKLKDSKINGYEEDHFNFLNPKGRCMSCKGKGFIRSKSKYFSFYKMICPECSGQRYNPQILKIKYRNKSLSDLLEMSIDEACHFFKNIFYLEEKFNKLKELGIGYLKLNQPLNTLSGGEAQRIMLCKELFKGKNKKSIFIFDEPSVGLHPHDIGKLNLLLDGLKSSGNTVIVIEHNIDIIRIADYIIDMGPDGGKNGGKIIFEGKVQNIVKYKESKTGKYILRELYGI